MFHRSGKWHNSCESNRMNSVAFVYRYLQKTAYFADLRTELFRKSIHILIALVPPLAAYAGRSTTLALLAGGVVFYTYAEIQRVRGCRIPLITRVTTAAARREDLPGRIIIGPMTLGLGAMISLLLYPQTVSLIAIYALAFGDSASSIIGRAFGRIPLGPWHYKTLEGSLACFFTVLLITLRISGSLSCAFLVAFTATVLEALPVRDLDNIIIPMGSGFAACMALSCF